MSTYSRRVVRSNEPRKHKPSEDRDCPGSAVEPSAQLHHNRLLAGCLAHEFLTQRTLFGQKWDPARAEAVPVSAKESKKRAALAELPPPQPPAVKRKLYEEVSSLLSKSEEVGIVGVLNPSQLVRWLQL